MYGLYLAFHHNIRNAIPMSCFNVFTPLPFTPRYSSHLLSHLLNRHRSLITLQHRQCKQSGQRQPHISPHSNAHARIVMTRHLVMLVRANPRRDMMEHRRSYHRLRIRNRSELRRRCGVEGYGVGEGDEDQREGDETPAVVADIVGFEIVGRKV